MFQHQDEYYNLAVCVSAFAFSIPQDDVGLGFCWEKTLKRDCCCRSHSLMGSPLGGLASVATGWNPGLEAGAATSH